MREIKWEAGLGAVWVDVGGEREREGAAQRKKKKSIGAPLGK